MEKTYKTKFHELSILVLVDGQRKRVDFKRDLIDDFGTRGALFTTEDVKLQRAIESHSFFNRKLQPNIWTDNREVIQDKSRDKGKTKEE